MYIIDYVHDINGNIRSFLSEFVWSKLSTCLCTYIDFINDKYIEAIATRY